MKLSGLINLIEQCIQRMDAITIKPHSSQGIYTNLTRRLLRRRWHQLLSQLSAKRFDQEAEVTSQQVDIIKQFFSVNWSLQQSFDTAFTIKTSDLIFTTVPLDLAKFLANILRVTDNLPAYQLLMPTADFTKVDAATNTVFANMPLTSLQLSDDNRTVFKVTNVLAEIDELSTKPKLYVKEVGDNHQDAKLARFTDDEEYRLYHHSDASAAYYAALCKVNEEKAKQGMFSGKDDEDFEKDIRQIKTDFSNALQGDIQVTATYRDDHVGFRGVNRLKKNLHAYVDELFESRDELFDYLHACLKPAQWEAFIDSFQVDVLLKLMTDPENSKDYAGNAPHDKIERTLKEEKYLEQEKYKKDDTYAKAVHFCLLKIFWKTRAVRGEVTSYVGFFVADEKKRPAKERGVNYLLSPLDGKQRDKQAATFEDIAKIPSDNAIYDGTLGILTGQMMKRFHKPTVAPNNTQVKQNK